MHKIRYGIWIESSEKLPCHYFEDNDKSVGHYLVFVGEIGLAYFDQVFVAFWNGYGWRLPYRNLRVQMWMHIPDTYLGELKTYPEILDDDIV